MAGFTIIDYQAAQQAISTFQGKMDELNAACNAINTTVQGLTGDAWSGEAATTYFGRFFEMYANLSKTTPKVEGMIQKLSEALNRYAEAEGIAVDQVQPIESGTAPVF